MKNVLVIHGGAGNSSLERSQMLNKELKRIYDLSLTYLKNHSALKTVVYAVSLLEDSPYFNAGTGSKLQQDGKVRMTASIMDGDKQCFSAVLNIEEVQNPIQVAELLLNEKDRVLTGEFATRFARERGFGAYNPITDVRKEEWMKKRDPSPTARDDLYEAMGTVGAVALDSKGRLAAATSTGGKGFERPGRVSDSGMPVGNFANAKVAISCTGIGEDIMNEALATKIAYRVTDRMSLKGAFQKSFKEVKKNKHFAGAIGIDYKGNVCADFSTKSMNYYPSS